MSKSDIERFWSKIDIGNEDECWPWTSSISRFGYGHFYLKGKVIRSHRLVWELTYGEIPKDALGVTLHILHHCDHRWCCNPSHLYVGTPRDNAKDREERNKDAHPRRNAKGYYWDVLRRKWVAQIYVGGKKIYLGGFDTEDEAREAYLDALKET